MNNLRSIESFRREELSTEDKSRIIKLSFEAYFQESVDLMKSVEMFDEKMFNLDKEYALTAKMIKNHYHSMSQEDTNEVNRTKLSFKQNIQNWFIKAWVFIVSIFETLVEIVVNLIKTLILYIQKKKITMSAMYNITKGVRFETIERNKDPNRGEIPIKVPCLSDSKLNKVNYMTMGDCFDRLNNMYLKNFITKTSIYLNNRKSLFNTGVLYEFLKTANFDQYTESTLDEKMNGMEILLYSHMFRAVIGGEPETKVDQYTKLKYIKYQNEMFRHGVTDIPYPNEDIFYGDLVNELAMGNPSYQNMTNFKHMPTYTELVAGGYVKKIANHLVYGTTTPKFVKTTLSNFCGFHDFSVAQCYHWYQTASRLVLDKGGYLDILAETLKKYKQFAVNDAKVTKDIKAFVTKHMEKFVNPDEDKEGADKITDRFKRFTRLFLQIRKTKSQFIMLRQYLIGNIITIYSCMDKAMISLFTPESLDKIKNNPNDFVNQDLAAKFDEDVNIHKKAAHIDEIDKNNLPKDFFKESDEEFDPEIAEMNRNLKNSIDISGKFE